MQMAGQTSVVVSSGAKGESRAAPLERAVHKLYRGNPDGSHSYLVFDDGCSLVWRSL